MTDTSEPSAPLATPLSRRGFLVSATIAAGGLAACTSTPRVQEAPRERIDREVQEAQSLQDFRLADGWELRVDAAVTVPQAGGASAGVGSVQINRPIQEVVFGQRGLIADASLKGAKYSRIIR